MSQPPATADTIQRSTETVSKSPTLATSLCDLRTSLRQDLHVTRSTNRGKAVYIIFDPVSYQSHRLASDEYKVLSRITPSKTLAQSFKQCVADDVLDAEDEEQFYGFIAKLSSLGLLTTDSRSPQFLYQQFGQSRKIGLQSRFLQIICVSIPLANPDKFLDRTVGYVRFLFTKHAFALWLFGIAISLALILSRLPAFLQPLNGLLALNNFAFIATAFLGLKIWHELGHGYACKFFGGRVPEIGCKLIVGMPLAYVNASAAWSFPKRRDRIIVMLGGIYFELLLVVPATAIWICWPHSVIGSFAYQLILMAGVATLLFNLNPLMKFDGYFILSDLVGIPNLRSKSQREVKRVFKSRVLGLDDDSTVSPLKERLFLLTYGIAASVYSCVLVVTIAALLVFRLHLLGVMIAAIQIGYTLWSQLKQFREYLLSAEETAEIRHRSRSVWWAVVAVTPLLIAFFPIFSGQYVQGVVTAGRTTQIRAATPGFVESVIAPVPDKVDAGQTLVVMRNIDVETELETARLKEAAAQRAVPYRSRESRADTAKQLEVINAEYAGRRAAEQRLNDLKIIAPHAGKLANILSSADVGKYLQAGEPIALIVDGSTQIRAWLDEEELATSRLEIGSPVSVRFANDRTRTYSGVICSVAPANKSKFEDLSLTTVGEGTIAIDPVKGETLQPFFQLLIDVPEIENCDAFHGVSAQVRVNRRYESLGGWSLRQVGRFLNSVFAEAN